MYSHFQTLKLLGIADAVKQPPCQDQAVRAAIAGIGSVQSEL